MTPRNFGLVLTSSDVGIFLHELARVSARSLSDDGDEVLCGITLLRHRKAATVASSSAQAQAMDEIQYAFGDGPCLTASREQVTVTSRTWRMTAAGQSYFETVLEQGVRSILAVPFRLEGDTSARNVKLHGVATSIVDSLGHGQVRTHFDA